MGLLDEIGAATKSRHRPCIVTEILDDLPIEDARELQLALDDAGELFVVRIIHLHGGLKEARGRGLLS